MFCNSWKHTFVYESNLIDPQPGYVGTHSGCTLYNNHMSALNFVLSDGWELNQNTPLDIHRLLTRGIPFFEQDGGSGSYRNCNVFIGGTKAPSPYMIQNLMSQWFYISDKLMQDESLSAFDVATLVHHMFEVVHPFIDGNGRTGRLLFQKVLFQLGHDPQIIFNNKKDLYYQDIQLFRDNYFNGTEFDYEKIIYNLLLS
jgi:Fic family protein